jgi:putative DNA primase/helicase
MTRPAATRRINAEAVKQAAQGRWQEIFPAVTGIDPQLLDRKHHPCPKCGGTDRFRMIDAESGALLCNQCFAKGNGDGLAAICWLTGCDFPTALAQVAEFIGLNDAPSGNGNAGGRKIVETYPYRDEQDNLLFEVVRFEPKDFRQRRPDGNGGWSWKLDGVRRVLYRLSELLRADPAEPVLIVEGEKDAERLRALGFVATTNAGGTGKWRREYGEYLCGRHVVVLPDNDQPGRTHAAKVARLLAGNATTIKVAELPGLPEKGDVSDWLAAGGTADELRRLIAEAPESSPPKVRQTKVGAAREFALTDLGNAERFARQHRENVRYCHLWGKWVVWDGRRWRTDETGEVVRLAMASVRSIYGEAANCDDAGKRQSIALWATQSEAHARIVAMVKLAGSQEGIPVIPSELDRNPFLLNCPNGTVDLTTGTLRPHERADLITKLCPVEFHPDTPCELWELFLDDVFQNQDLIEYMQILLGYCLTGDVRKHVLPIFWGKGANGKSTLLELMIELLGEDYAIKAPHDMLMAKRSETHPTERADLFGKRLVVAVETDECRRLAESLVKDLTGADTVRARRMREDFWQFRPTHKLILATNHKPEIRGTDHAIWRRVQLVPFTTTFTKDSRPKEDEGMPEKLRCELRGILAWCVRGCLRWQAEGFLVPEAVRAATAQYRSEQQDVIASFITDCCATGSPHFEVRSSKLYEAYSRWCDQNGEHAVNQRRFGQAMTERGFERFTRDGTWYRGVGLILTGDGQERAP